MSHYITFKRMIERRASNKLLALFFTLLLSIVCWIANDWYVRLRALEKYEAKQDALIIKENQSNIDCREEVRTLREQLDKAQTHK